MDLTWQDLLAEIIANPQEKQRMAKEISVNPLTLFRWAHKESKPRNDNILALLKVIPHDRAELFFQLVEQDFPTLAEEAIEEVKNAIRITQDPPVAFYVRVLRACANTPASLYTYVICNLILQQMVEHLDAERQGIAVRIMGCLRPAQGTHIRSLWQINGIGTSPWKRNFEQNMLFLGAESLAGTAVMSGRLAVAQSREEEHVYRYWTEYEQSAAAYPLMHQARIAGCLLVLSARPHYFTETHVALIEQYANLMALAFKPEDFLPMEMIALSVMPHYRVQEEHFRYFGQRVTQKIVEATAAGEHLTLQEAQAKLLQVIEEEFLKLPPM